MIFNKGPGKGHYNTQKSFKIRLGKKSVVMRSRVLSLLEILKTLDITSFQVQKNTGLPLMYMRACHIRASWRHLKYYVVNVVNVYSYYLQLILKKLVYANSINFKKISNCWRKQYFLMFAISSHKLTQNKHNDNVDTQVSKIIATRGGFY
jgi:hypothetical protein